VGAVWVIFRGDLSLFLAMAWNRGDLIFLGGCLAMGLYTPLIRLLHRGESMLVMTFWILITGCIWLLLGLRAVVERRARNMHQKKVTRQALIKADRQKSDQEKSRPQRR